mgnify:CR=1 FL=1
MAKRLSEEQKKIIIKRFKVGISVEYLAEEFNCTNATIVRNLKKDLGENLYKELLNNNKKSFVDQNQNIEIDNSRKRRQMQNNHLIENKNLNKSKTNLMPHSVSEFIEISPLNIEIEDTSRKEFSSIAIEEIELPKLVYMIVSKNIELEIKLLSDYPEWEFLPNEDLERKTIEIYFDLKIAKRNCNKEQKVIKVPNTDVFRIASSFLISKGISRIIAAKQLIAL